MKEVLFKVECYQIQGAVFDVYREMGAGFLETVYQECLEKEFTLRDIPFISQQRLPLSYKGSALKQTYVADFVCYSSIIVEIKAVSATTGEHQAHVLNYLKCTGFRLGLLVNFGCHPKATVQRFLM
ncbi:MAG: GxxExxY protein [Desulfovibrionales bacterium]|nr:MAG: GxxExxY protein [Desulfovibrionales bacterium]